MSKEIEKLKIVSEPEVSNSGKNGVFKTKTGKPFFRVVMEVEKYGTVSGLVFDEAPTWKAGDEIEASIKEEEYQGKRQLKFELPSKGGGMKDALEAVMQDVHKLKIGYQILLDRVDQIAEELDRKDAKDDVTDEIPF